MVVVLFIAGDHVPVIVGVFVELVGNATRFVPEQMGAIGVKVGRMEREFMVIV